MGEVTGEGQGSGGRRDAVQSTSIHPMGCEGLPGLAGRESSEPSPGPLRSAPTSPVPSAGDATP